MRLQLTEIASQEKIDLNELPAIIGRDSTADIQLDDPTLPPLQCMIDERADGVVFVWNVREDFPLTLMGTES